MKPNEIKSLANQLILNERACLEREIINYETAIEVLLQLIGSDDLPSLWRAVHYACDAEYDLGDGVGACAAAQYHDTLSIPDCYEPGENEPCKAYNASEHYCRRECPLRKWTTKKR